MSLSEIQKERNEQCRERHELAVNRIRSMVTEETVEKAYVGYFQDVALFFTGAGEYKMESSFRRMGKLHAGADA